jgi:hypothetical protein
LKERREMPAKSNGEKGARQAKQYKVLRRVRVQVDRFSEYGIRLGDTAIIAMTGEVRLGELGYFSADYDSGPAKQFKFVVEQDEECKRFPSTYKPGGVCLRTYTQRCWGVHEGAAYGRVVAIERDRQTVETTLSLRPYDEREGPATTRLEVSPWPEGKEKPTTPHAIVKPRATKPLYDIRIHDDILANLGLVRGDAPLVYPADDLKLGDAASVELRDQPCAFVGRVVAIDAESITLRNEDGDETLKRSEIVRAGRIDLLNVPKRDALTGDERERVNKLRKRLDDLGGEDDQIIRCTARYEIEKQIFDIEHPTVEDPDDWSAWEEEGEAEA